MVLHTYLLNQKALVPHWSPLLWLSHLLVTDTRRLPRVRRTVCHQAHTCLLDHPTERRLVLNTTFHPNTHRLDLSEKEAKLSGRIRATGQ